jgi:hypothetical protein
MSQNRPAATAEDISAEIARPFLDVDEQADVIAERDRLRDLRWAEEEAVENDRIERLRSFYVGKLRALMDARNRAYASGRCVVCGKRKRMPRGHSCRSCAQAHPGAAALTLPPGVESFGIGGLRDLFVRLAVPADAIPTPPRPLHLEDPAPPADPDADPQNEQQWLALLSRVDGISPTGGSKSGKRARKPGRPAKGGYLPTAPGDISYDEGRPATLNARVSHQTHAALTSSPISLGIFGELIGQRLLAGETAEDIARRISPEPHAAMSGNPLAAAWSTST